MLNIILSFYKFLSTIKQLLQQNFQFGKLLTRCSVVIANIWLFKWCVYECSFLKLIMLSQALERFHLHIPELSLWTKRVFYFHMVITSPHLLFFQLTNCASWSLSSCTFPPEDLCVLQHLSVYMLWTDVNLSRLIHLVKPVEDMRITEGLMSTIWPCHNYRKRWAYVECFVSLIQCV